MNNRDPLVARKKAHQAIQPNVAVMTATMAAPAPKNGTNVSLHLVLRHIYLITVLRGKPQLTFIIVLLSAWKTTVTWPHHLHQL